MGKQNAGRAAGNVSGADTDHRLLNEHEAARILGLKVATLRRWRWAGKPPVFRKINSAVRYHPADISALIDAGRRTSTSDTGTVTRDRKYEHEAV